MLDIIERIDEFKRSKIKRYPCRSNRPSSLGYFIPSLGGCLRRGVLERTNWQDKELHDLKLQYIFDEGREQEKIIILDLLQAGVPIVQQQCPYEMKEHQINGMVDTKLIDGGKAYPVEIKSMSPYIFDKIYCAADLKKFKHTAAYIVQLNLYMYAEGIDKGLFLLKNKSTGAMKQIEVALDYDLVESALKAAEVINGHIAAQTLPAMIANIDTCKECPFKLLCLPGKNFGCELQIADDIGFEQKLDERQRLKDARDSYEELDELIKSRVKATIGDKEGLNIIVGKYRITAHKDKRGAVRQEVELI